MPTVNRTNQQQQDAAPDVQLTKAQKAKVNNLITKYSDEVNTGVQSKVVDEMWKNMQQEVVARYVAPVALRYLVPMPDDKIVAEYIAPAPADLTGNFDPNAYTGSGPRIANTVTARSADRTTAGSDFPMVAYYLIMPPPPDPKEAAAFNKLRKQDQDINKIFSNLLKASKTMVKDGKLTDAEVQKFTRLHYAFDLAAKKFYDGVGEYFQKFPNARADVEEAAKHRPPGAPPITVMYGIGC